MMLMHLAETGALSHQRGDAAIFSNTSAEHPATYKFVADCKQRLESQYGIPLFSVEFATYEDSVRGEWARIPSYRLVNDRPISPDNPNGYRFRGETFRELTSFKAFIPNQFRRVCTSGLKIEPTRMFISHLLGGRPRTKARGLNSDHSVVETDRAYRRYLRRGGGSPEHIYRAKRIYVLSCPPHIPAQNLADFSAAYRPHRNALIYENVFGGVANVKRHVQYLSLIGLRADEEGRVSAIHTREAEPTDPNAYTGELVYTPLADMDIEAQDVADFW